MSRQTNYYKLGLFIIGGTVLFVLVVIFLGAGNYFRETLLMETYVDESVNGLEVGSPIKFRGVKVGSVSRIDFLKTRDGDFLSSRYRYVLIEGILGEKYFEGSSIEEIKKGLQEEIKKGLRVRPTSQGITGQLFLDVNYLNPSLNPPLEIDRKRETLYIPSAPSTLSRIESAFNTISEAMRSIDKAELSSAVQDFKKLVEGFRGFLAKADMGDFGKDFSSAIKEAHIMIARINRLLEAPEIGTILPDASSSMAGLSLIVGSAGDDIISAAKAINEAAEGLSTASNQVSDYLKRPEMEEGIESVFEAMKNLNTASVKVNIAASRLNEVMERVNGIVAGQQINIQAILENTRLVLENLKELSDDIKRYPSEVLFGEPPKKVRANQ
ncbi:MAG: MCE family protein [Deltaproteobacteria bacterium]|nr:MCE family protein [Deltaproteobacteria bacterium]